MNWKDHVVELWVPKTKGGKTGTAFWVASDKLMTARHVVRPKDRSKAPIEFFWKTKENSGWIPLAVTPDPVVWECEKLDLALLHVDSRPKEFVGHLILRGDLPEITKVFSWEGRGFPEVAKQDHGLGCADFRGDGLSMASFDEVISVTASGTEPDTGGGWKGASGMPVYVEGLGVVGVCIKKMPNRKETMLSAAAVTRAFTGDHKDCSHGSLRDQMPGYQAMEEMRARVKGLLGKEPISKEVQEIVLASLKELDPAFQSFDSERWIDHLLDAVQTMPPGQFFSVLSHDLEIRTPEEVLDLRRLTQVFAPYAFWVSTADLGEIRARLTEGEPVALPIALPAGTHCFAEIIMAAAEDRPVDYHPRDGEEHRPLGRKLISLLPVMGSDQTVGGQAQGILDAIMAKYPELTWVDQNGFIPEVRRQLGSDLSFAGGEWSNLRTRLLIAKQSKRPMPYLAVVIPNDLNPDLRENLEKVVNEVARLGKPLPVLTLDVDLMDRDLLRMGGFHYFLPIRAPDA
ncbi:hypothetical protein [Rhodospirillum sp. A1_3_36]|uniref:hypothetical protein n=1 Tax=Rhodospirillum sp. A1_3_36 TaxID=3391666 RepID=UPI0039A4BB48